MEKLLQLAKCEASGGDLTKALSHWFSKSPQSIPGVPEAVIWKAGCDDSSLRPVVHALTDAYALVGTVAAIDILQLPCLAVPMWAQYRQDTALQSLSWFGKMPYTSIKWSTAGDAMVRDASGQKVVVQGKSGNAPLRIQSGVFCNERSYGNVTVIRSMPCLPYSQDRSQFQVDTHGVVRSVMHTPGVQMAYANRYFLQKVHETGALGRVAMKPTQAMEDGINAGLHAWLLEGTRFTLGRQYAVNPYHEHKEAVDRIIALLPSDFKKGMSEWTGHIEQHIADTNYGLLLWDVIEKREVVVLSTDLDGDRLTDLLADVSDPLRVFAERVSQHHGLKVDAQALWSEMGYVTGNGRDMMSLMHRMQGEPIYEQTLGSADAMLLRLIEGDETLGETKRPYDPRIHFVLIREAYLAANPKHKLLQVWFDKVMGDFDQVYAGERPGFLEGYALLKERITPWGA